MRSSIFLSFIAIRILAAQAALPTEWIDSSTGHRVIRLSREDGTQSLYFNQNAYTADGKKLIVTTAGGGIEPSRWRPPRSRLWCLARCRSWWPDIRAATCTTRGACRAERAVGAI